MSRASRRGNKKGIVLDLVDHVRRSLGEIPTTCSPAEMPGVVDRLCDALSDLTDAIEELVTPPAAPERSDGPTEDRPAVRRRGAPVTDEDRARYLAGKGNG